jgi:hypothetical protein
MKVLLTREDLKPEHENIPFSASKFKHFNKDAQAAIVIAGEALFVHDTERIHYLYNKIYPPK